MDSDCNDWLFLHFFVSESRTFASTAVDSDSKTGQYGAGPLSKLSGYRIRIVSGKSEGYEGIISGINICIYIIYIYVWRGAP